MFDTSLRIVRGGAFAARSAIAALAFTAGVALAAPAAATTVILQNGTMDHPRVLNIATVGNVYATPMQFDGLYGAEPFTDLVAFCVDVFHAITLGDYNPDLVYTDSIPLTTDSNWAGPSPLTAFQITQIGNLVHYGTNVFYNAPQVSTAQKNARWDELAVVQGAIWQVVSGKNVTSTVGALNTRIDDLAGAGYAGFFNGSYGPVYADITLLTPLVYPARPGTQAFAFVAVPEPAAWALMIGGFALAGAALRRRRSLAAA